MEAGKRKEEAEAPPPDATEPPPFAEYAQQCDLDVLIEGLLPVEKMPSNPFAVMDDVLTVQRSAPIRKIEALWRCNAVGEMTLSAHGATDSACASSSWVALSDASDETQRLVNTVAAATLMYRNCTDIREIDKLLLGCDEVAADPKLTLMLSSVVCKLGAATMGRPLFTHIAATSSGNVDSLPVPVLLVPPYYVIPVLEGAHRTFAPCVEVLTTVYHAMCRGLEVTDAFHDCDGRGIPDQLVSMTTDRTFSPDDIREALKTAIAETKASVVLGRHCDNKDSTTSLAKEGVFSAIDCPGPIAPRKDGQQSAAVCSLADHPLYTPPPERKPAARLQPLVEAGYGGVVLRPASFNSTTDILDFVKAARKSHLAVVVDTTAVTVHDMDSSPLFLAHLACGIAADAVLLPVPTSAQSTALYNEFLRIDEAVIEECRRYRFRGATPWLNPSAA